MAAGVLEWRVSPDPFSTKVPRKPQTTPSARLQATQGKRITNLRGETVMLDDLHCIVLRHLEGKQDHGQLVETVGKFVAAGGHQLKRESDNQPVTEPAEMRALLKTAMEKILQNLAAKALLVRDH